MANVYDVVVCPHCKHGIVPENHDKVMVHGAENLTRALALIEQGMNMKEVKTKFCRFCGEYMPCGCKSSAPQEVVQTPTIQEVEIRTDGHVLLDVRLLEIHETTGDITVKHFTEVNACQVNNTEEKSFDRILSDALHTFFVGKTKVKSIVIRDIDHDSGYNHQEWNRALRNWKSKQQW